MGTPAKRASRSRKRGIFCLEGDWWNDLNRSSTVKPVLKLLCQTDPGISFVHRDVGTLEEFKHYLGKWVQKGRSQYPVLYLAFHGDKGVICVGDQRRPKSRMKLDDLAALLEDKCNGRIIHLGSCGTLDCDARHIQRFLQTTGASAVTGFSGDIGWLKSSAFEALLFDIILDGSLTISGARRIENEVYREIPQLAKDLSFRIVIRK